VEPGLHQLGEEDVGAQDPAQPLARVVEFRGRPPQDLVDHGMDMVEDHGEQGLLALDAVVDGADAEAGVAAQRPQAHAGKAVAVADAQRPLHDPAQVAGGERLALDLHPVLVAGEEPAVDIAMVARELLPEGGVVG
jgi:hypothetical protein